MELGSGSCGRKRGSPRTRWHSSWGDLSGSLKIGERLHHAGHYHAADHRPVFTVSIDYLLDFNLHNADEQVEDLCGQAFALRKEAPAQAEEILREGLRRFPNNEIILDHLVYVLKDQGKLDETVLLCRQLIDSIRDDEIKYDAYFILLDAYKQQGNLALLREGLNAVPELYFTKLELKAPCWTGRRPMRPRWTKRDSPWAWRWKCCW